MHFLLWCKNAPKLGTNSDEEKITYIDKFVSCCRADLPEHLQGAFVHSHRKTTCTKAQRIRRRRPTLPLSQGV